MKQQPLGLFLGVSYFWCTAIAIMAGILLDRFGVKAWVRFLGLFISVKK